MSSQEEMDCRLYWAVFTYFTSKVHLTLPGDMLWRQEREVARLFVTVRAGMAYRDLF